VKLYFTFLGFCLFIGLCLVYIKTYGVDDFTNWAMRQALNYAAVVAGGGLIIDIIRGARE